MNEFNKDKQIDPNQLDVEACQQAELFFKWSEKSIEAQGELDRAKLFLETIEAELDLRCRDNPSEFSLAKVTESAIKAVIKTHRDYIEAYHAWIKAKETAGLLGKAAMAMEQKKRMIETLVTLHGQQYFAGPSVPRDLGAAWLESQKDRGERVSKKQAARIRKRQKEETDD
jgi:hypothetical protein